MLAGLFFYYDIRLFSNHAPGALENFWRAMEILSITPRQAAWMNDSLYGYAAYKINDLVKKHEAWGLGVYCYFRNATPLYAERAIEVPPNAGIALNHAVNVWLNGQVNTGCIAHVVNDTGGCGDLYSYP